MPIRLILLLALLLLGLPARAQGLAPQPGETVPAAVETMYQSGLGYLARTQLASGAWPDEYGRQPGVVALAVLAFLAHGEDPQAGPYAQPIARGLDFLLRQQDPATGYIGTSMYHHGFATLALAEAYGMVREPRVGPALDRAVKLLLAAQATNRYGGWRYSPDASDADTTVSGACLVALFAARNAGLPIPEQAFRRALDFYRLCQSPDGGFGYAAAGDGNAPRAAIGTLVFALAKQQSSATWRAAHAYLATAGKADDQGQYHYYYLYYGAQAFFHGPDESWRRWNERNVATLARLQRADGAWQAEQGAPFGTACALLSLALNYRYLPIYER
jgi:hypothetical protein